MVGVLVGFCALFIIVSAGFMVSLNDTIKSFDPDLHQRLHGGAMFWWAEVKILILVWYSWSGWFAKNGCSEETIDAGRIARFPFAIAAILIAVTVYALDQSWDARLESSGVERQANG
jgi:hypothetical protein